MKYTFAIACLLGLTAANQNAEFVARLGPVADETVVQILESDSDSDSNDEETNVDISADKKFEECTEFPCVLEKKPVYKAWDSVKDGAADGKYERLPVSHFSGDSDDIFMRSMVSKYAYEKRTSIEMLEDGTKIGGEPTGSFWMSKSGTRLAAKEVLGTHKGLSGDKLSGYLDTYFDKAWENFDVNGDGSIEVIKSPMFMRFLASDQAMSLGESA